MKTIKITIKQLMLVIAGSASIPLFAFVLGFNFSTHQHYPDASLRLDALALNDLPTETQAETRSVEPQESSAPIEILQDGLGVVGPDTDRTEPEETPIVLDANITRLETVDKLTTDQQAPVLERVASVKGEVIEEALDTQSNTRPNTWSNKQLLSLGKAAVEEAFIPADNQAVTSQSTEHTSIASPDITSLPPYVIQLALFSEKQRALLWTRKHASKARNIKIFTKSKSNQQEMYAVVAGFYSNKSDAKLLGERLSKRHHMDYFVAKSESLGHEIFLAASNSVVASVF